MSVGNDSFQLANYVAGAYGIQGWGGIFVPRIEGDYFNVMGLPLAALRRLCRAVDPAEDR